MHLLSLQPKITCYVLRTSHPQNPLERRTLELTRIESEEQESFARFVRLSALSRPSPVLLNDVMSFYPSMTKERLRNIPDDQIIFFWADVALFNVSSPVKSIYGAMEEANPRQSRYTTCCRHITDGPGNLVVEGAHIDGPSLLSKAIGVDRRPIGITGLCETNTADDDDAQSGLHEFILIATNSPPESEVQNVVLQTEIINGIRYRVNIGEIEEEAWNRANVKRTLVALG